MGSPLFHFGILLVALYAIDYANWAVENARLQTLDTIDARAYAKAAGLSGEIVHASAAGRLVHRSVVDLCD